MMVRRTTLSQLARGLAVSAFVSAAPVSAQSSDDAGLDKLLAPIALYPDALLAQVLTASTSPEQVKEFNTWLKEQDATGSDLQQAATDAGYEASFASLALFPEVVSTLASNMDWTKELGTAYLSKPEAVMSSVQRLREQAQKAGNLKTNEQQTVTTEGSGSTQTIVIQPTNPQVVYVPQYDAQAAYAPPPPANSGNTAMAALIGFAAGIAIGAAIDNDPYYYGPYGWGAWGMGWHGSAVVYRSGPWVVPVRPRYPYVRPVPGYRPNVNVVAPRRTNVTVNVNSNNRNSNNRANVGNQVNAGNRTTNVNTRNTNVSKGSVEPSRKASGPATNTRSPAASQKAAPNVNKQSRSTTPATPDRGRAATPSAKGTGPQESRTTAMGGYSNGASTKAASQRGKASTSKAKGKRVA